MDILPYTTHFKHRTKIHIRAGLFHVRLDSPTLDYSTDGSMYDGLDYHYWWSSGEVGSEAAYGGWYNYKYECGIFAHLDDGLDNAYKSQNGSLHREP